MHPNRTKSHKPSTISIKPVIRSNKLMNKSLTRTVWLFANPLSTIKRWINPNQSRQMVKSKGRSSLDSKILIQGKRSLFMMKMRTTSKKVLSHPKSQKASVVKFFLTIRIQHKPLKNEEELERFLVKSTKK
jgi:hypothetical protein